jgi:hypothetical protein
MCASCGLPQRQTARSLTALCGNLLRFPDQLDLPAELTEEENAFSEELIDRIEKSARRFLDMALQLPGIVL